MNSPSVKSVPRTRLLRLLTGIGVVWLVVLHAILLAERISDGSIVRPEVTLRWLATAGILAALLAVRRYRSSLRFGRASIIALWIIAALLHAGIPSDDRLIDSSAEWLAFARAAAAAFGTIFVLGILTGRSASSVSAGRWVLDPLSRFTLQTATPSSPRAPPAV